ncbi:MAG: hypothetical protein V3V84_02450 [Candidatus Bathyarchaeia archaeon]
MKYLGIWTGRPPENKAAIIKWIYTNHHQCDVICLRCNTHSRMILKTNGWPVDAPRLRGWKTLDFQHYFCPLCWEYAMQILNKNEAHLATGIMPKSVWDESYDGPIPTPDLQEYFDALYCQLDEVIK